MDGENEAATEIIFKCDPNATPETSEPQLVQMDKCLAVFEWKHHLFVVAIASLHCSECDHFYNLRQLSTISSCLEYHR